jgi:hypothetical protein
MELGATAIPITCTVTCRCTIGTRNAPARLEQQNFSVGYWIAHQFYGRDGMLQQHVQNNNGNLNAACSYLQNQINGNNNGISGPLTITPFGDDDFIVYEPYVNIGAETCFPDAI